MFDDLSHDRKVKRDPRWHIRTSEQVGISGPWNINGRYLVTLMKFLLRNYLRTSKELAGRPSRADSWNVGYQRWIKKPAPDIGRNGKQHIKISEYARTSKVRDHQNLKVL